MSHSWQTDTLRTAIERLHSVVLLLQVSPAVGFHLAETLERVMTREQKSGFAETLDPADERERVAACLYILDQILASRLRQNEERCVPRNADRRQEFIDGDE